MCHHAGEPNLPRPFRAYLRKPFGRAGAVLSAMADKIYPSNARTSAEMEAEARVRPWFAIKGDQTLRLQYDLAPSSVVFDLGGYEGQWTSDIYAKYKCTVHVFEPARQYAEAIAERFRCNDNIIVHQFGLAQSNQTASLSLADNASSIFGSEGPSETISLIDVQQFLDEQKLSTVDLMKINIEGGEYDLIDRIIETGIISRVTDIQVQFHDFVPDARNRRTAIQGRLQRTHKLTYEYPFVWENWRILD